MVNPKILIQKTDAQVKVEQRQAKITALDDKKKQGELTMDDIYEQN